jgi:uncharacterized protein YaaN involved in tellurite resistance
MNIHDLIKEQTALYGDLKEEKIQINTAKELNRAAGTIISSYARVLKYQELRGEKPHIPGLEA